MPISTFSILFLTQNTIDNIKHLNEILLTYYVLLNVPLFKFTRIQTPRNVHGHA